MRRGGSGVAGVSGNSGVAGVAGVATEARSTQRTQRSGRDEARQLGAPEALGGTQVLLPQPGNVVAVRPRPRQPRLRPLLRRRVAGEQLAEQDRQRPAVENPVVVAPDEPPGRTLRGIWGLRGMRALCIIGIGTIRAL